MKNYKQTAAFSRLQSFWNQSPDLQTLNRDAARNQRLTLETANFLLDLTKTHLTPAFLDAYGQMLDELDLDAQIEDLFSGRKVNNTEGRPALHTALRSDDDIFVDGQNIRPQIREVFDRIQSLAGRLHQGELRGITGKPMRYVVNIGIGGSYLGPLTVTEALKEHAHIPVTFLSNVDDEHLQDVFRRFPPEETLYAVVSKSFSTPETLMNARHIQNYFIENYGHEAIAKHFVAVTAHPERAEAFGIAPENIFPMWDFVGGRYSLWSAAGISIALSLGYEVFARLLAGARQADADFRQLPLEQNPARLLAAVTFLYNNLAGYGTEAYIPYRQRLQYLPLFLQQLIMESNGKSVQRDGRPVVGPTSPVVFGDTGTNAQHSFFQALHQGTQKLPVFFLGYVRSASDAHENRRFLLANMLAQAESLAFGRLHDEPHKHFPGNRPSVIWLWDALMPENLGYMLAVFEHKTFVESVLWNINAFDQFGVELGKINARKFDERLKTRSGDRPVERFISKNLDN